MENNLFIDTGVESNFECKFDFNCYGEICLDAAMCRKKWCDFTIAEKNELHELRKSCGMNLFLPQSMSEIRVRKSKSKIHIKS